VHGVAHQVQPDHLALLGQRRQLGRREASQPGPQPDVGGERRLGLHPCQVLDRVDRGRRRAVQQELAGQRGTAQAPLGQRGGHRGGPKTARGSAAGPAGARVVAFIWSSISRVLHPW